MGEKKRKESARSNSRTQKKSKTNPNTARKNRRGPHLPSSLKKQLDLLNPTTTSFDTVDSDDDNGVYEYEEQRAEEESTKNKRYDPASVHDDLFQDIEVFFHLSFILSINVNSSFDYSVTLLGNHLETFSQMKPSITTM